MIENIIVEIIFGRSLNIRAIPKKSRFGLSAWAHAPSTRKRNTKNILNQDLQIFKTIADPFEFTDPARAKPRNVKREIVRLRGYTHMELKSEDVAEFSYRPTACDRDYRMVVVRKNISKEKGEARLIDEIRYVFYISNDDLSFSEQSVVFEFNK